MKLPKILHTISNDLDKHHAETIIVGGAVMDHLLGLSVKDYDIEVYGIDSIGKLESILSKYGSINLVGRQFGVLKFIYRKKEYDFSLPRSDSKVSAGHRGFEVTIQKDISFKDASKRRDFTINSMGYGIKSKKIIDPYGGAEDLKSRVLKHIDPDTFTEDPLRVYRAVQFAARFDMELDSSTESLCKNMVAEGMLDELPKERVFTEWQKLLLKSDRPSIGFELMRELGIIERYFPELHTLIGCPQDPQWHPEGDVWIHTMMAIDSMAKISDREGIKEKEKLKLMLAALCHDLGKPTTTTKEYSEKLNRYRIRAIGHEKAGLKPTTELLDKLTNEQKLTDSILPLVEHHLKPSQLYAQKSKPKAIRRLSTKVNIDKLVLVSEADFLGRTTPEALNGEYMAGRWLLNEAKKLNIENRPPKPLIQGRDLIELGMKPSPKFKELLNHLYEKQLDGEFGDKNEALWYIMNSIIEST